MKELTVKAIRQGLEQIPAPGLLRLIEWIDNGKPLLLDGRIWASESLF
jgi:hypothetical protein